MYFKARQTTTPTKIQNLYKKLVVRCILQLRGMLIVKELAYNIDVKH